MSQRVGRATRSKDPLGDISDEAMNAAIDRSEFDAVMKKLLGAKRPISKEEIAERVRVRRSARGVSHAGKRSGQR